jgi:hypothetical protein
LTTERAEEKGEFFVLVEVAAVAVAVVVVVVVVAGAVAMVMMVVVVVVVVVVAGAETLAGLFVVLVAVLETRVETIGVTGARAVEEAFAKGERVLSGERGVVGLLIDFGGVIGSLRLEDGVGELLTTVLLLERDKDVMGTATGLVTTVGEASDAGAGEGSGAGAGTSTGEDGSSSVVSGGRC